MTVSFITHEEATIKSFMDNPEYANYLLDEVKHDGDTEEIEYFQDLYDEAQKRLRKVSSEKSYWDKLTDNVKTAISNGENLGFILSRLNDAVKTVKAAMV